MTEPMPPKQDAMPFEEIVQLAKKRNKRKKSHCGIFCRLLRALLLLVLFLLLAIGGSTWWLLNTENGLRFALFTLPEYLPTEVRIHAQKLNGTIWEGFAGENWKIETEDADINVSHFIFKWHAKELWNKHLHISHLDAGDVHIQTKETPPKPKNDKPMPFPKSISLPLTVAIDHVSIGKITQGKEQTVYLRGLEAAYIYDQTQHHLSINSLKTPWSNSKGVLTAKTKFPFILEGLMNSNGKLSGELDNIAIESILKLSGNLQEIKLNSKMTGNGVGLSIDTAVSPFAPTLREMIGHIQLSGNGINPRAFLSNLPEGSLDFSANVMPEVSNKAVALTGDIKLHNAEPMPVDKNGIPVRELHSHFAINESSAVELKDFSAQLMQQGKVDINGAIYTQKQTMNLLVTTHHVTTADVILQKIAGQLNGVIQISGTFDRPKFAFNDLETGFAQVAGIITIINDKKQRQSTIVLDKGEIRPKDGGRLKLSASLEQFKQKKWQAQIQSEQFNPHKLYPDFPEGSINGRVKLTGELEKLALQAQMQFDPSSLSGALLTGGGKVFYENNHLQNADVAVRLGKNEVQAKGSFGKKGDHLDININAENLQQFGFHLGGSLIAKGTIANTADSWSWTQLEANLDGQAHALNIPNQLQVNDLNFSIHGSPDPQRPLNVVIKGKDIHAGTTNIDDIDASLKGTLRQHHLQGIGNLKLDGKSLRLNVAADGGVNTQNQWQGTVSTLDIAGMLNLQLQNTLHLEAGKERVVLNAAHWQALGGALNLDKLVWDNKNGLMTKGSANGVHLSELHNLYKPPIEHDLVLSGDWDLSYSHSPRGYINLRQQGGDITLPTERNPKLGLTGLVLKSDITTHGINSQFSGDTHYGKVSGNFDILQGFDDGELMRAPIAGTVDLDVAELNNLRNLMPVGQTVKGQLTVEAKLSGTLNDIKASGIINGNNLYYRDHDVGIILANGILKSHIQERRWFIDSLVFTQNNGRIALTGTADYSDKGVLVDAKAQFEHYPVLDMPNRKLVVSGNSRLTYDGNLFDINGNLKADEGRFGFQEGSMPTLDSDVVVLNEPKKEPSKPMPLKLNLVFDLNDHFYFSAYGLNVTLGGKINLEARPSREMQATGSVNIVKGQYKAYGQDLVISKGIISFVGPLMQPNLNIRAERRNSPVGAGVEVLGNATTPRISLVANEPMSEKDKLSWLILNRASSGSSSDEATLSTAASAFLAGKLNDKLGLVDDFGLTSQQTRNAQTGEMNPAQQVLTFGKQLSQNLYIGYEAGLADASQSVKLIYQLSKAFQAIARAGTQSYGGELKYQKRFD